MRSLAAALLTAQKASSGVPFLRTIVADSIRDQPHLTWSETYSASNPDDPHDAAADADYLHRVRLNSGNVQYERDAGSGWTTLDTSADQVSIAAVNDQRVIIAYSKAAVAYYIESTNQGGSWGSPTSLGSLIAPITAIAVTFKNTSGDLVIIAAAAAQLRRVRRTSGSFGSWATWPASASSINGVSVVHAGDFHIILTGTDGDDKPTLWSYALGDGFSITVDNWAVSLQSIIQAEDDANITFQAPYLAKLDTHRLTFVEKFSGTTAYTRTYWSYFQPSQTWATNPWLEPAPLDNETEEGLAITSTGNEAFLSRPNQVLEATVGIITLDMSANLIEATMLEGSGLAQRGTWIFDNSAGQYKGPPAPIAIHHDLRIDIGYDALLSGPPIQSITGWEYGRSGGRSTFILHTQGVDLWLGAFRSRTTTVITNRKMTQIVTSTAARAGIENLNVGPSTRASTLTLDWTTHPHQSHLSVLQDLLAIMPDNILTRFMSLHLNEPKFDDATDYDFTTEGHTIYHSRTKQNNRPSFMEIIGVGVLGQDFDFAELNNDRPLADRRQDPNTTTAGEASDLADARQRKAIMAEDRGYLIVPPHCGLEIDDVIEYSDALVSASSIKARVRALRLTFRRTRNGAATFEQRIDLGGL